MEIFGGEGEVFGEGAAPAENPENGAVGAMAIETGAAGGALAAAAVDLSHHPAPEKRMALRTGDLSHELMAQHTAKIHVAPDDLEIGRAHPGQADADERFALTRLGLWRLAQVKTRIIEKES